MAVLCGAMIGSLRALWPFRRVLLEADPQVEAVPQTSSGLTIHELYWPASLGASELQVLATVVVSAGLVLLVSQLAQAHEKTPADRPPG